jgi:2'-5' RNA ligase/GNAT superfamily N-acetyltransferase
VALLVEPPLTDELQGLRRGLGDPSLDRVAPHLTLVPPVNVRSADLPQALLRIRKAAAAHDGPLHLTLGPITSFLPVNPVVYLAVSGDLDGLRRLRDAVFAPPLERKLSWPWVPHVTLADGIDEARIPAGLAALSDYTVPMAAERIVLLEEQTGRMWRPLADASFGRPSVVGTGGLALEIAAGRLLDPEVLALPELADGPELVELSARCTSVLPPIVRAARREGEVVGAAVAWADGSGGHVGVVVRSEHRRQGIGTHLLAAIEIAARLEGWRFETLQAEGPAAFYQARSGWSIPIRKRPKRTSTTSSGDAGR